jgi:hypothetical protein
MSALDFLNPDKQMKKFRKAKLHELKINEAVKQERIILHREKDIRKAQIPFRMLNDNLKPA